MKRIHVWIKGNVQGVFFRANTRKEAMKLNLKGWVQNLSDGRVEAVFEGDDEAIKSILNFCEKGPLGSTVSDIDIKEEEYKNEFEFFEIHY